MESEAIKLSSCFSFARARVMLITLNLYFIFFTLTTELKIHYHFNQYFIYHLPQLISTLLFLAVYRKRVIHELSLKASLSMSSRSSGIEHPSGVREVIGLIPVHNSDFFFVLRSCHVDISSLLHLSLSLKFTIIYFINQESIEWGIKKVAAKVNSIMVMEAVKMQMMQPSR